MALVEALVGVHPRAGAERAECGATLREHLVFGRNGFLVPSRILVRARCTASGAGGIWLLGPTTPRTGKKGTLRIGARPSRDKSPNIRLPTQSMIVPCEYWSFLTLWGSKDGQDGTTRVGNTA